MEHDIKIYKPVTSNNLMTGLTILAIVLLLTVAKVAKLASGTPVDLSQWIGLAIFWSMGLAITVLPFGFRLEVGDDYITSYFLGLAYGKIRSSDVQKLEYGSLLLGGLGFGKGLKGWKKTRAGRIKYFSLGENFYSKEAVEHARQVLDPKNR